MDGEKLASAKAEFKQLEEDDIIQHSTCPWSSPLHMVKKADGSWRLCRDFPAVEPVSEPDVYPVPNMLDFAAKAAGCTVFSKIDLRKGYHQIPVNQDVQKTAITTPFGLFEYKRMPVGLRNAGPSFQRLGQQHRHLQQEPRGSRDPRAAGPAGSSRQRSCDPR